MTSPLDNERVMAHLEHEAAQAVLDDLREMSFHEQVKTVPGPLGVLLRQISTVRDQFVEARKAFGTTEGEADRLYAVLEDAMSLVESLGSERPEVQP